MLDKFEYPDGAEHVWHWDHAVAEEGVVLLPESGFHKIQDVVAEHGDNREEVDHIEEGGEEAELARPHDELED